MPVGPEGGTAALSRDGKRIFCICRRGEINLTRGSRIMVREAGSEKNLFLARFNPRSVFVDECVVPSPDGRRVAAVVYGCLNLGCPEDFQSVVTVRLDGGGRTGIYTSVGLGKRNLRSRLVTGRQPADLLRRHRQASGPSRLAIAGLDGIAPTPLPGTGCRSYCEFAPRPVAWTRG